MANRFFFFFWSLSSQTAISLLCLFKASRGYPYGDLLYIYHLPLSASKLASQLRGKIEQKESRVANFSLKNDLVDPLLSRRRRRRRRPRCYRIPLCTSMKGNGFLAMFPKFIILSAITSSG